MEISPYYSEHVIPADAYGLDSDTTTVAVAAMVIARDDVEEDVIYTFIKTIFDGASDIQHSKAEDLDIEFASSVDAVPYHPGAAKFFSENGIEVSVK